MADAPVEALTRTLRGWSEAGRYLCLGARPGVRWPGGAAAWTAWTPLADHAVTLGAAGLRMVEEGAWGGDYDGVAVLVPGPRATTDAWTAAALRAARPGGAVVVCGARDLGGPRAADQLVALAGGGSVEGLRHCRVGAVVRPALLSDGIAALASADAPLAFQGGPLRVRPGMFSADGLDTGSALLARTLPTDLRGIVVDLGAGWGWLSSSILAKNPGVTTLHLVERDTRALALAVENLAGLPVVPHAADATTWRLAGGADAVVMNPPFHDLGATSPALGVAFVEVAADLLRPSGVLWMVANAHLPYERALRARFRRVVEVASEAGFKVLTAFEPVASDGVRHRAAPRGRG
jgi:16S rRNA (guanine1207-N2)-methyltransferase